VKSTKELKEKVDQTCDEYSSAPIEASNAGELHEENSDMTSELSQQTQHGSFHHHHHHIVSLESGTQPPTLTSIDLSHCTGDSEMEVLSTSATTPSLTSFLELSVLRETIDFFASQSS
jgi:hypothetical protein